MMVMIVMMMVYKTPLATNCTMFGVVFHTTQTRRVIVRAGRANPSPIRMVHVLFPIYLKAKQCQVKVNKKKAKEGR